MKKIKEEINMKLFGKLLDKLIKDDKINFSFYNNSLLKLELLQICYDKPNNTIELEFRDIMGEHLKELKEFINKGLKT